jgi:integrase/recombinase XerD
LHQYCAMWCGHQPAGRIMSFGRQNGDAPSLFDARGQRKYLCDSERRAFLAAANKADAPTRIFCHLLAYTGCRISEGLAVTPRHLDADGPRVIFRTLKRRKLIYRAVPIPIALFADLSMLAKGPEPDAPLWQWCRQTAWRHIHEVMQAASINGPQATPRGLRHGFCMNAAMHNIPPNLIQRWAGHASPDTTAIYVDASGVEEQAFAERMW